MNAEQQAMDWMRRTTEAQERTAQALERIAAAIECFTADVIEQDAEQDQIEVLTDLAGRPIN